MITRVALFAISLFEAAVSANAATHTCSDLRHYVISATSIGLPTRGGLDRSAQLLPVPGGPRITAF